MENQEDKMSTPQTHSLAVLLASQILQDDIAEPPTLRELAKIVGVSHPKLNQEFRKYFGTTVFGYLRKLRLEKARELLVVHHSNVTETAFQVGYESLPSFSRAFSLHFGHCPRKVLKQTQPRKEPQSPEIKECPHV